MDNMSEFIQRHIGPSESEQRKMLADLGLSTIDELVREIVPDSILLRGDSKLPEGCSEQQALTELKDIASHNVVKRSLIGQGYYGTITPSVILRNVFENPAWYTSYTPYQAEISQGRLEALFNYQTLITELTGLPVANASAKKAIGIEPSKSILTILIPNGLALVCNTSNVCGNILSSTIKSFFLL